MKLLRNEKQNTATIAKYDKIYFYQPFAQIK